MRLALLLLALIGCRAKEEPLIRLVADPTLPDVAMAWPALREIHFNPHLMAVMDPGFASFVLLHEQAHVALGHRIREAPRIRRRHELAADCWASARADSTWRRAAIQFFEQLGPWASDYHPTGYQRAAEIERCGR